MTKDRLAELLIKTGMLNQENLKRAVDAQKMQGGDLGRTMVDLGLISEETLVRAYATLYSMQAVTISPQKLDEEVAKMLPKAVCEQWGVIPFRVDQAKKYLDVAQSDPTNLDATDEIRRATKYTVRFFLATRSSIANAIAYAFYKDNMVNVGMGAEVEFTFGGDGPAGMQMTSGGRERGTSPRGGYMEGSPNDYAEGGGIPLQTAGESANFQPVSDQGVSFSGNSAQGPMPMVTTAYGGPTDGIEFGAPPQQMPPGQQMRPQQQTPPQQQDPPPFIYEGPSNEPTFDQSGVRQVRQAQASSRPVRDELLDMSLGRTGTIEKEDGPREIQIDLDEPPGGETTSPGRPPPVPATLAGMASKKDVEKLQAMTARLEEAITMNRGVLEKLLRLMIKKGFLSREEAMEVVRRG